MSNRDSGSVRDSVVSSTSRFSSLLSPGAVSSTTSTFPIPQSVPSLPPLPANQKRTSVIYDRPLVKSRGAEVSLGAWAYLFAELVQYTQKRVSGISEFEKRLSIIGYRVGARLLELLPLRDYLYPVSSLRSPPPPSRTLRLLPILTYVHSTLYRYLFGRPADSLERSTDNDDEYMIGDDDMIITRGIEVPKEMKDLSCGALVAGIVEAVMDGAGFPARVTAHSVPSPQHPRRTVILIKLDPDVLAREAALSGGK
ncbi:TRAPP complex subunit Trs31 [Rhodotorula toruloides]|uniref:TRAPP complex subunit Trs31 n=1 Tax=Rhodotorula toruloides TaxID=5286 RepID=A0A511KKP7_RHOTO|nr:TRAPP complex subunit Trs31 [Rhodotorula toruloides]